MAWDQKRRWLLAFDEVQILYDGWWDYTDTWSLRSSDKDRLFYKDFTFNFKQLSTCVGYEEITPGEIQKFGLDLPMNVCRHKNFQWGQKSFSIQADFTSYCRDMQMELTGDIVLNVSQVVLIPYSFELGMQEGIIITADNHSFFTQAELLWKAYNIQSSNPGFVTEGVGLHRQGWEKKLPSFYIGGFYDLGDYLRMHELIRKS